MSWDAGCVLQCQLQVFLSRLPFLSLFFIMHQQGAPGTEHSSPSSHPMDGSVGRPWEGRSAPQGSCGFREPAWPWCWVLCGGNCKHQDLEIREAGCFCCPVGMNLHRRWCSMCHVYVGARCNCIVGQVASGEWRSMEAGN